MNPIDYIGADVSADEIEHMTYEERDAVEAARGSGARAVSVTGDDLPDRPGVIRH